MKILVADDEELARQRILYLLQQACYKGEVFQASNGKETLQAIQTLQPDLVFLDIQMTDMTGFDVLHRLDPEKMPVIIFATAFDTFAVKAFEYQALDFLLKPFKNERFFEAFKRGMTRLQSKEKQDFKNKINQLIHFLAKEKNVTDIVRSSYLEKIVLKVGKKYYFVVVDHIKYITAAAYYAEIYTKDNSRHLYRISMSDLIKKLDPKLFIRVNRSAIINLKQIKEVISEGMGEYGITMKDGKTFSLTKNYRAAFLEATHIK